MTPQQLVHAHERVQQKWYALIQAEKQGASIQTLEHLYACYITSAEEYNRCYETYQHCSQSEHPLFFKQAG